MFWHGIALYLSEPTQIFLKMFFLQRCNMIEKPASYLTDINQQLIKHLKMKKIILSLAIGLAVFTTAFAKPDSINDRAVAAFQKDFHKASDVSWASTSNYVMATFMMDNETQIAYYDFQGNLIGVVHHMLTSDLPADLRKDIKKRYSNYWVSELFQITTDEGVYYYIRLKNADETIALTTEGGNGWHRFALPKNTNN
jgi:hypothetical protein